MSVLVALSSVPALTGCNRREPVKQADTTIRKDSYVVRGIVEGVPSPADPRSEFVVHHESMPHFRGPGGKLGMNTMSMAFPLAPELSLGGLKAGDKIELSFEVDFDTQNDRPAAYRATAIRLLEPETELSFAALPGE